MRPTAKPIDPASSFERRYQTVLIVVATLVLLNQLLVQPALLRIMTDAPVINVAGRQRMLSQRLAKAAIAIEVARDDAEHSARRNEVEGVLRRWTLAHESLRLGDSAGASVRGSSRSVQLRLDQLEPSYREIRNAASELSRDPGACHDCVARILGAEATYLEQMDGVVALLEQEANERVDRVRRTGWIVTGLILCGLALVGRLSLRPAVGLIRRQILELDGARRELEEKVRERTRDLEHESRERLRAEEHQRRLVEQFSLVARTTTVGEMATGLAHELNQPLGAIANYAEGCLILTERPSPDLGEIKGALHKVLYAALRAGQIVSRIRKFVTRHEITREWVEPNRLVAEVREFFQEEAERRNVLLQIEVAPQLPLLWCDPVQIQQVLVNLIRNALESLANPQPTAAKVVMQVRKGEPEGLEFLVKDNGEGIPADRIAQVFESFFSTRDEGMGMGLAISRTIVEAHQGRIEVESTPGEQTTFRFVIPPDGGSDARASGLHR